MTLKEQSLWNGQALGDVIGDDSPPVAVAGDEVHLDALGDCGCDTTASEDVLAVRVWVDVDRAEEPSQGMVGSSGGEPPAGPYMAVLKEGALACPPPLGLV